MKLCKALFILLFIPFIGLSQDKECEYDLLPTTYISYDSIFFKRIGVDNKVWFIVYDDFNDVFNSSTEITIFSLNGKTVCGQSMSYLCNVNEYLIKTLKQWSNIKEEEIQYLELLLSLFESYEY